MKPPPQPVCKEPQTFPAEITNRAGLDRIAYRVGAYGNTRRWLLEQLDRSEPLAAWTYRSPDDPGIALYEGAALLVDSLTFYQEAYANEAYLRTATWRESVADLVRLTGYRLKPGIGGAGTFAFEVSGTKPVTIPARVAVTATLATDPQQASFETAESIVALPQLSKFSLVRPQHARWLAKGMTKLVVARGTPLTFAKDDRIAIGVMSADGTHLGSFEVVIVDAVETWHGRSLLTLKGPITKLAGVHATLTAIKLGKTFHLAGHNAPEQYVSLNAQGTAVPHTVSFVRETGSRFTASFPRQETNELALEPQTPELPLGTRLVIQATLREPMPIFEATVSDGFVMMRTIDTVEVDALLGRPEHRCELATIADARSVTVSFGPLSVPSTIVTLDKRFASELAPDYTFDIRQVQIDTALGAPFVVGPVWTPMPAPQTHLVYWGDPQHALELAGRRIGIVIPGKPPFIATVLAVEPNEDHATVILDREIDFDDFADGSATRVYGNLADVTEGKRADDTVLGSGDDRATFQSFELPKSPLTYLAHAERTPPEQPELEVVVGGRIWKHVPVLFGQPPDAEVFIVRQADDGKSWVQFGDGKTGARLPSGVNNVVARYRTGAGAHGPLADGAKPSADRTVKQITGVELVDVISGGAEPEAAATAKLAAPARVQTLDRIVSITDVEAEALAIGGVSRARAVWTIAHGVAVVQVTLLMQAGRTAELASASSVLATASRTRGPQRFPIVVVPGAFEYVYLDLTISIDPSYDPQPVRDAVTAALGAIGSATDASDGLFGERSPRSFGDAEYATRIEGVAQNVPGVQWALVNAFGSLGVADDPSTLVVPEITSRAETVGCASTHVLRLHASALQLHIAAGAS